jgi:hypothetical protein
VEKSVGLATRECTSLVIFGEPRYVAYWRNIPLLEQLGSMCIQTKHAICWNGAARFYLTLQLNTT